jgi:hypothetical protein
MLRQSVSTSGEKQPVHLHYIQILDLLDKYCSDKRRIAFLYIKLLRTYLYYLKLALSLMPSIYIDHLLVCLCTYVKCLHVFFQ